MRNEHFPGWARPYEFASELLVRIGKREEEARDLARVSLRLPWWSLLNGYGAMKEVAQLEGTPAEVRIQREAASHAGPGTRQGCGSGQEKGMDQKRRWEDNLGAHPLDCKNRCVAAAFRGSIVPGTMCWSCCWDWPVRGRHMCALLALRGLRAVAALLASTLSTHAAQGRRRRCPVFALYRTHRCGTT
eukprot:364647-Chlamydomonas_euryale.AAC.19